MGLGFLPWNFHQQGKGFHAVREVGKGQGKVREENFLPMQIFNFKKNCKKMHVEMCAVELYMTISCIYDAIICI